MLAALSLTSVTSLNFLQHLGGGDGADGYEEMVCDRCMASHDFLKPYKLSPVVRVGGGEEGEKEVVVDVTGNEKKDSLPVDKDSLLVKNVTACGSTEQDLCGKNDVEPAPPSAEGGAGCGQDSQRCELARRRKLMPLDELGREGGAGYFSATWRSQLCRCPLCMVSNMHTQS